MYSFLVLPPFADDERNLKLAVRRAHDYTRMPNIAVKKEVNNDIAWQDMRNVYFPVIVVPEDFLHLLRFIDSCASTSESESMTVIDACWPTPECYMTFILALVVTELETLETGNSPELTIVDVVALSGLHTDAAFR